ncbi:MAG: hypothetical protein WBB69_05245 [Anaerolineales bacterium]
MDTEITSPQKEKPPKKTSSSVGLTLLRLLLTIAIACLLGAVIYYAAIVSDPILDINPLFQSQNKNNATLQALKETQAALENKIASFVETLDSNQSGIDVELLSIQSTQEMIVEDLQNLVQDSLENQTMSGSVNYLSTLYPELLATLAAQQSANSRHIDALATAQMSSPGTDQEIKLLMILDLLGRANQFLLHSNFGLAEETLAAANTELHSLLDALPDFQQEGIADMQELVEGALADLPAKPTLAAEKLELAWQIGISGLPYPAEAEITDTPTLTPSNQTDLTTTPTPP